MLIASQVTAVVGGQLWRVRGGLLGVQWWLSDHQEMMGGAVLAITMLPVTQLEQKRFEPHCRT